MLESCYLRRRGMGRGAGHRTPIGPV